MPAKKPPRAKAKPETRGRPATGQMRSTAFQFQLHEEDAQRLEEAVQRHGFSNSLLLRMVVKRWLDAGAQL